MIWRDQVTEKQEEAPAHEAPVFTTEEVRTSNPKPLSPNPRPAEKKPARFGQLTRARSQLYRTLRTSPVSSSVNRRADVACCEQTLPGSVNWLVQSTGALSCAAVPHAANKACVLQARVRMS